MAIQYPTTSPCVSNPAPCPDPLGCPEGVTPDFILRRHDTQPPFRLSVEDCDGSLDLTGLVLEASMWCRAKLKAAIDRQVTSLSLADNIGFNQIQVGDVIQVDRPRAPERMLVKGFDETSRLVWVERGHEGTTPSAWKKGQALRVFRFRNAPARTQMVFEDIAQVDGTVATHQLTGSFLEYDWLPSDTCLPGCFYLEFLLRKLRSLAVFLPNGTWGGLVHQDSSGAYFTGTQPSVSSVPLSLDAFGVYHIPGQTEWRGPVHLYTDDLFYTGFAHDDGSVPVNATAIPVDPEPMYTSGVDGVLFAEENHPGRDGAVVGGSSSWVVAAGPTDSPSPGLSEASDCCANAFVEWERRFPTCGEGFLIRINDSPTTTC